jgi:hypothetical protein
MDIIDRLSRWHRIVLAAWLRRLNYRDKDYHPGKAFRIYRRWKLNLDEVFPKPDKKGGENSA